MSEQQPTGPIEDAPKLVGQSVILLWVRTNDGVTGWWVPGGWDDELGWHDREYLCQEPTHFHLMPSPPSGEKASE